MGFLIYHPSVGPIVQQAAQTIYSHEKLYALATTIVDDPASPWQSFTKKLAAFAGSDLEATLARRAVENIPRNKIICFSVGEYIHQLVVRLNHFEVIQDAVWEWAEKRFDRKVSAVLSPSISSVYGYEHASLSTFRRAKELGINIVYDVPAPETMQFRSMLRALTADHIDLDNAWFQATEKKEPRRLARRRSEWARADRIVCASNFTKKTFSDAGYDVSNVKVVPYGAPQPIVEKNVHRRGVNSSKVLELIWAGTFSLRKGAHLVVKAWNLGNISRYARLRVFGSVDLPVELLRTENPGIEFCGVVSRRELLKQFENSDALLFPTIYDGFGMVITEALSRGLPVITTTSAGASELMVDRREGLVIEAGRPEPIASAVEWCLQNPKILQSMRYEAIRTAKRRQWSDYRHQLWETIKDFSQ